MSYGIIRIQKFKTQSVRGIQSHDQRERESRSNPDISKDKTPENYKLQDCADYKQAIQGRLKTLESDKAVRKDAVVMAQVLVTSDSAFFQGMTLEKQREFFQQSLDFVAGRYGKENMLSATVHMDEKTPHMHVNLTPIRDRHLTAKEIFNREEFSKLHTDFHAVVGKKWGLERGESREEKRKHLDTEAFKLQTRKEQIQENYRDLERGPKIPADSINPRILGKKMLGLANKFETSENVADRLTEKYVRPLAMMAVEAKRDARESQQKLHEQSSELQNLRQFKKNMDKLFKGLATEQFNAVAKQALQFRTQNAEKQETAKVVRPEHEKKASLGKDQIVQER
jgi:hypothetical protein